MAYLNINRDRYRYLLRYGTGDDELRRFFADKRVSLIQKGGKVQNLPRGPEARITAMLNLPSNTDSVVQQWFSANLAMIDPAPVDEVVDTFCLYEDEGEDESLPVNEVNRLSRSCLVHLFLTAPSDKLVDFLKSPIGRNGKESNNEPEPEKENDSQQLQSVFDLTLLDSGFVRALVALLEGKDPDEHLSMLPPAIANLVIGLYAIKEGHAEEASSALDGLGNIEQVRSILSEYEGRIAKTKESYKPAASGIQINRLKDVESPDFDFDRDQIIGKCTKDYPETAVFIQPFAIRTYDGQLLSLEKQSTREALFPMSGDVQAFSGPNYPRQPARGEIGIWHIAPNETHGLRNNFHLRTSKMGDVYEVRLVPFISTDYDSVRGFIKEQTGNKQLEPLLFQLRDGLIVGCPSGKDLTKDEGFDEGLPCWSALNAFRFEGRLLVPGPLPAHEHYECATLASTLKKFFSSNKADSEKLTRAQKNYLRDWVKSGESRLGVLRQARLLEEIKYFESDDEAIALLLNEAMKDEKIAARIEQTIQEKADAETSKKSELKKELEQLEKQRTALIEDIAKQEKVQRAIPSLVSKAVKASIKKAKEDAFGTLGQVVMFKTLMEGLAAPPSSVQDISNDLLHKFRNVGHDATPLLDILKSLGLSPKHAKALELTGDVVFSAGMILVIEGIAARLVAEAWGRKDERGCMLMDCEIGLTEDRLMKGTEIDEASSLVILDANLSPPDVYVRPLLDRVQRRILSHNHAKSPKILMSLSASVASLPLPSRVEALAVRIALDQKLEFMREEDVEAELENIQDEDAGETWASRLWKPALVAFLRCLKSMPTEDAVLVLSALKALRS